MTHDAPRWGRAPETAQAILTAEQIVLQAAFASLCIETARLRREIGQRQRLELWAFI
jgi:hypothetical protein